MSNQICSITWFFPVSIIAITLTRSMIRLILNIMFCFCILFSSICWTHLIWNFRSFSLWDTNLAEGLKTDYEHMFINHELIYHEQTAGPRLVTVVLFKQVSHILVLKIGHHSFYFTLDIQQGVWAICFSEGSVKTVDVFICI